MIRAATLSTLLLCFAAAGAAPTPREGLLKPPADAEHFVFVSEAGKHGDEWRWTLPDGRVAYRQSTSLRGWIYETDAVVTLDDDGMPVAITVRGVTPDGDAAETFTVDEGTARWQSTEERGSAPFDGDEIYVPASHPLLYYAVPIAAARAAADGRQPLLPSGTAAIEPASSLVFEGPQGKKKVTLHYVTGILSSPLPVWLDEDGEFFAYFRTLGLFPEGYEGNIPAMKAAQDAAETAAIEGVAKRFLSEAARAPVLFDDVMLFDADGRRFVPGQAVLVKDGRIAQIGDAGSIDAGDGTRRIDGRGHSLVPGLWDAHRHIGDDYSVLQNVASGIVNFRSPGTEIDRAVAVAQRRVKGELVAGEVWASAIVDQKHPLAAQGAMTVTSEAEAIAAVREIHEAGLFGVKFYTSMKPEWIAPAAAEAHRLGLHVSGHVPATMRPLEAVRAGYDELTHINFVAMQLMPQAVVDQSNTNQRLEGPLRYAKDMDLDGAGVKAFIAELADRGTVVDPTLVIFESLAVPPGEGQLPPAYAPYAGLFPAPTERQWRTGGYPLVEGLTRDDYRDSVRKLMELVGVLHEAGITIVAGTDGQGIELVREVELYEMAGMSRAEALATATLVPAEVVGADGRTGSIRVGKEADLVLVDGDVSRDLGALRRVVTVVSDGTVMDAAELRAAAGITGTPK